MKVFGLVFRTADVLIVVHIIITLLATVMAGLLVIVLMHTLSILGRKTMLYRTRQPAVGWSKRFYPACLALILLLVLLMWALTTWSRNS